MKKKKNVFFPEVGAKNPVSPEFPRPSQGSFMHISDPTNGDLKGIGSWLLLKYRINHGIYNIQNFKSETEGLSQKWKRGHEE